MSDNERLCLTCRRRLSGQKLAPTKQTFPPWCDDSRRCAWIEFLLQSSYCCLRRLRHRPLWVAQLSVSWAWIATNSKKQLGSWILKKIPLVIPCWGAIKTPDNHGLCRHQIFSLHQNVTRQVTFMVLFYVPICLAYKCLSAGNTSKLLNLWKTKTKTIMAFLKLSGQKWVEMWVKRRHEVIAYNMHDLFVPSCGIIKCLMCVIQHSRSCYYQGATEAWRRQVWAELPRKKKKKLILRTEG